MRARSFSTVIAIALAAASAPCIATEAILDTEPPRINAVLIVADNQSPSLLGAYGSPGISTPDIDRLAAEGIRFENAYAVSGVCSPTRAALLTGLFLSQTGVHNALPSSPERIGIENWSAIEEFRTLPATLQATGYRTALVGKYHLGSHAEAQIGFDH